ncbi:Quinol monooxygenase YgiN [Tangfeifania diversioriginum]|uniref:Quinol monooxygenase YgiN n=1 Tax=Tangfeifania diversioriginum TaxID=1168035 RepID=A0A1M6CTQ6_9BACT|nr:putative quinol monooxygenase [Tangfeifania diversioriginum]SHI64273.1 Quinol monooxygenase YgiN [Tangfeifania diversioriginum]
MISIVAKFRVHEGQEEKFLKLVNELSEASQKEKGCIEYMLFKDVKKALDYCIIEKWQDQAAVDEHNNTKHFTNIVPQLTEIAEAEIDIYQPV